MTDPRPSDRPRLTSYVVIPARLRSKRLPRKLLLTETGKPLIQHTYEAARQALQPTGVCVAADGPEIADAVTAFGGEVHLTDPDAACGTDRVAELARQLDGVDVVVNLQGDEPEITGQAIDLTIELLEQHEQADVATLAVPIREADKLRDPACVKVVLDQSGRALYFSRCPIPFASAADGSTSTAPSLHYHHVGLYAYRREFLLELTQMPPCELELAEDLEQLRVLWVGRTIQVGIVADAPTGINTSEDYRAFVARMRSSR